MKKHLLLRCCVIVSLLLCFFVSIAFADTVWEKTFGGSGVEHGRWVQQTNDGGYIIVGNTGPRYGLGVDWDVYLIKTDSLGNEIWSKTYGGSGKDNGNSVQQTDDGGFIVAGSTWYESSSDDSFSDVYLLKTDPLGNEVWSKTFGGDDEDWGSSVQQTTDGGYIISGGTDSFGAGSSDVYLIYYRTDEPQVATSNSGGGGGGG